MRNRISQSILVAIALALPVVGLQAQQTSPGSATTMIRPAPLAANAPTAVPALVPYSGAALDDKGSPLTGEISATFLIYKDQQGGEPLFTESQVVAFDGTGHYKVQLGAANSNGLPPDLFSSGEARWLEVQVAGEAPQARVLLASVPYALKAADAATLGGFPASAFVLAGSSVAVANAGSGGVTPDAATAVTTTGGTANQVARFSGGNTIVNSLLYDNGTNVGVGTTSPSATLTVNGTFTVDGAINFNNFLNLNATGTATASTSYNSQAFKFYASAYNSSSKSVVLPHFEWLVEPTGNNTSAPNGALHFLASANSNQAIDTGLYLNTNGVLHFASGQTFPATSSTGTAVDGTSTSGIGVVGNSGSGTGVQGTSSSSYGVEGTSTSAPGVLGYTAGGTVNTAGVVGQAGGTSGFSGIAGVWGDSSAHVGVYGSSKQYAGVFGQSSSGVGVQGSSVSANGVYGFSSNTSAIHGETQSASTGDAAVYGGSDSVASGVIGVSNSGDGGDFTGGGNGFGGTFQGGTSAGSGATGLQAMGGAATLSSGEAFAGNGVYSVGGTAQGAYGYGGNGGIFYGGPETTSNSTGGEAGWGGIFYGGTSNHQGSGGYGIYVEGGDGTDSGGTTRGPAAGFVGDVSIDGTLSADVKDFKIDHPSDPANKYLVHTSIESSEMVNIYSGNVVTDELGLATVQLPGWFETLNGDLRYQLTVVGRRAQAWISQEVKDGKFQIASDATNTKVSWQITGVRQDAYAKAHPLVVEEPKNASERGFYKHPELYGQPAEKQTEWGRHPATMRHLQEVHEAQQKRVAAPVAGNAKSVPLATAVNGSPDGQPVGKTPVN